MLETVFPKTFDRLSLKVNRIFYSLHRNFFFIHVFQTVLGDMFLIDLFPLIDTISFCFFQLLIYLKSLF